MKFIKTFLAKVTKDGKLAIKNKEEFDNFLIYKLAEKDCVLSIEEQKSSRSLKQNAYYWAFLDLIESGTGNLASDIHEIAKRKFLPPRFVSIKGQEYKLPASTTDLDKKDFGDYLDKISAWSGVPLPNPDEYKYPGGEKEEIPYPAYEGTPDFDAEPPPNAPQRSRNDLKALKYVQQINDTKTR